MFRLCRMVRLLIIRWQIHYLEEQAQSIIDARRHALVRLMDIQRDCLLKQELLRSQSIRLSMRTARR